jgi:hypothetical protein
MPPFGKGGRAEREGICKRHDNKNICARSTVVFPFSTGKAWLAYSKNLGP